MDRVRAIAIAAVTGGGALLFLTYWMHAPDFVAVGASAILFVAVLAANGDRSDRRALAADAAWREAAPDLPPVSERTRLERRQAPRGPKPRRVSGGARTAVTVAQAAGAQAAAPGPAGQSRGTMPAADVRHPPAGVADDDAGGEGST